MTDKPANHAFYVEVTIAACVLDETAHALGQNMVDVTLGFFKSATPPPHEVTDAQINKVLGVHIAPVIGAIQAVMTQQLGFAKGEEAIEQPMTQNSKPTGEMAQTPPVVVRIIPEAPGGKAQA